MFNQTLTCFCSGSRLQPSEWEMGVDFLTQTGQMCDDKRQEFILLSDILGLSMLVVDIDESTNSHDQTNLPATLATVLGPFYAIESPRMNDGDDVTQGAQGKKCRVSGSVKNQQGQAIGQAKIEVWQADETGLYDVQVGNETYARAHFYSQPDGRFSFQSILPEPYPIPVDGPVGRLLRYAHRPPWRPAHLHFKIQAVGYKPLITHIFRQDSQHLDEDPVFGVKDSLIADWAIDSQGVYHVHYDFVLSHSIAIGI
ncbi:MAG: dioxygenase [Gammaproteobacteria bacterium]|nr:dioxygenase [Gammaproteobacteria bacterium]